MMEMDTYTVFLKLLRQAIGMGAGESPALSLSLQACRQLMNLCDRHGVSPLVYNQLLAGASIPQEEAVQMKQVCLHSMLLQTQWEPTILKAFGALEQAGVRAVLLKGFGLASLYPKPYLRSWGDADIWVGVEQYHQACGVLRETFPEAIHHDEEWDELKHYCFVFPDGKAIELHRVAMDFLSPREQHYWCQLEQEGLSYANNTTEERQIEIAGKPIVIPEDSFNLLFCFMHSWEHFCSTGIPLKQVADMVLLWQSVRRYVSCSELEHYLLTHLRALHMLEEWRYYGYMTCKTMGIAYGDWPLLTNHHGRVRSRTERYGERMYERVMQEGQCRSITFETGGNRYEAREVAKKMNVLARKMMTLRSRFRTFAFMRPFAPQYAWHHLVLDLAKGIRRTIKREKMIDY